MLLFTHIVEVLEEHRFAGQLFMPFKMIYYLFREGVQIQSFVFNFRGRIDPHEVKMGVEWSGL